MTPFNPTLGAKDTALNVNNFIANNMDTFWDVLKPLLPWIIGLHLFDIIVTVLFFADSKNEFGLGGFVAAYFVTAFVITWHRIVIHGPDNFTPMSPFKPHKHELVFMGVGVLLGFFAGVFGALAASIGNTIGGQAVASIFILIIVALIIFLSFKVCFYFPAKAINHSITFGQSYALTQGYFWKLMGAGFLSSLKYMLIAIVYFIVLAFIIGAFIGLLGEGSENSAFIKIIGFAGMLPLIVFIQPMLSVIGVTVLSNYFQHALQNKL